MLVDRLLPRNYDPLLPPKLNGNPVNVDVKISILNIRSIKETELSYIVDIFYHQYWSDYRILPQNLTLDQRIVLDNKWRHKLWIPDSYFKNALSGHVTDIIFPTLYFAVHNQTELFMASRVSLQLSCDMDFVKFPHDTQTCYIDLMSLSHNTQTVTLSWKEFYITNSLHLPQFWLSEYSHETCMKKYAIGNFSCLRATIKLKRQLGLYIVKKYIPSTLIVVMSFVGFWIPVTAYPARVALVITALLALITQQHQSSEVNVSYVIALNVWMIICIAFVFFALIEYAIAIAYQESQIQKSRDSSRLYQKGLHLSHYLNSFDTITNFDNNEKNNSTTTTTGANNDDNQHSLSTAKLRWIQHFINNSSPAQLLFANNMYDYPEVSTHIAINSVDKISRYLFPIAFISTSNTLLVIII
ncbi:glycine receptor subunit alpha-1-like [Oppia nitens]|uniref:glycine receptor subunit alpha-1-like n=1 Tax=Oppia nitens TaxID=1686743 RepID=UPI0023DCE23B|nr:glycine receptor subunit alpha-1-like [Oppia nitens]